MLAMRRIPHIFQANRIRVFTCGVRCHTHSSSTTIPTHTTPPLAPHTSNACKSRTPSDTTPDTLINLAVKKDVSGIILELENMHNNYSSSSSSQGLEDKEDSSSVYEPELATLAANLFFNEKVTTVDDVTSIDHLLSCCDIFDLLNEKHPILAQQGYSKLLEFSLTNDRLHLVCCLCTRLLAQDIRLEKPFYDTLISYLTGSGQVDQALALAHTVPPSRQILLSVVEPLFLSHRHMEFASLFRQYCLPFNNECSLTDVNLVVISMIWAKGLCSPLSMDDREEFVASIVRSLDTYRIIFHDTASLDSLDSPHSRAVVNKLFRVMKESLQHVFLNNNLDENAAAVTETGTQRFSDEEEETAGIVAALRRKFVTSRYFSPFPFMPQDSATSTNFSPLICDITAQVESASASHSPQNKSIFFLSNYMWQQDYADVINSLVEERDEDGPYYDDEDGESDSDSDSDIEDDESLDYAGISSDEDDSSDEETTEYSIDLTLKVPTATPKPPILKFHKRVDMESHLARGRDELTHSHQPPPQESRDDAMRSFISGFQIFGSQGQKISLSDFIAGTVGGANYSADSRSSQKVAWCDKMSSLGYMEEDLVQEMLARHHSLGGKTTSEYNDEHGGGGDDSDTYGDISSQCRHGESNLRLANDLFGYVPPHRHHHHFAESAYDSIKFIKDDVNWGRWKR